jgi:hypothetical protein
MAFPSSPSINDTYLKWKWNGNAWEQVAASQSAGGIIWGEITAVYEVDDLPVIPLWSVVDYV